MRTLFVLAVFSLVFIIQVIKADKTPAPINSNTTTTDTTTTTPATTTSSPFVPHEHIPTFWVDGKGGSKCMMLQANINVKIRYFMKSGEIIKHKYLIAYDTYKKEIQFRGKCQEDSISLLLDWNPDSEKNDNRWKISVYLKRSGAYTGNQRAESGNFVIDRVDFSYYMTEKLFKHSNETNIWRNVSSPQNALTCPVDSFYKCIKPQTLTLTGKTVNMPGYADQPDVDFQVRDFRIEAFRTIYSPVFTGLEVLCHEEANHAKILPIVVGVILSIMVLAALVIFFVGSRRRQRAYERI